MKLGPVGGIFNLAVILKDSIFDNQDVEKFVECMAPKAVATKHLDELTRKLCPELQYFVVFSSVSRGTYCHNVCHVACHVSCRVTE